MIGIEFTFNDGTKDYYDPVDFPKDFEETDTDYLLHLPYEYKISKSDVKSIRHYDLCEKCGYELYAEDEGSCRNFNCIK